MAKLIGTAGHVDHGKTTLIRVLTGIDADRLPEEKARGMTIDIGFAYIDLPQAGRVSIVDVPGHERFLSNMLVGALGMDLALLCVAADESVMPQTVEHLQILELLPVQRLISIMTRCDLADDDLVGLAEDEVRELLDKTRFAGSKIVRFSANGLGVDGLRAEIDSALAFPDTKDQGDWYIPVDRAFSIKGHGSVVTGSLARGVVTVGDEAAIEPDGLSARIRGLHVHDSAVERSVGGQRTAANLSGVKLEQLERGQVLGRPGTVASSDTIDAEVRWIGAVKHGMRARVSIGADEVIGRVFLSELDDHLVQLRLERRVACVTGQPLIIRRYSPPDLLGGGTVTVPAAKRRRLKEPVASSVSGTVEEQLLGVVGEAKWGISTEDICRQLGRTKQALGPVFEQMLRSDRIMGFAGIWFNHENLSAATDEILNHVAKLHERNPTKASISRDEALPPSMRTLAGKPFDRFLQHLASTGRVAIMGHGIRHPDYKVKLSEKQAALLERVVSHLESTGISAPSVLEVAGALGVPSQAIEEILRLGVEVGQIAKVSADLHYSERYLRALAEDMGKRFGVRGFSAAEFRDAYQTSRKYVIPLLEYFDVEGITIRTGDLRYMKGGGI